MGYNLTMKLGKMLRPEALDAFYKRKATFIEEIRVLHNILDVLEKSDNPSVKRALFEIACVRAVKLLHNSGYTFKKLRLFLRGNVLKPFRKKLFPILEKLETDEKDIERTIKKVKSFRDHEIVHLDPRFAFENERDTRVSLDEIKEIVKYLKESVNTLFDTEY